MTLEAYDTIRPASQGVIREEFYPLIPPREAAYSQQERYNRGHFIEARPLLGKAIVNDK
jgi:hypothetical protein